MAFAAAMTPSLYPRGWLAQGVLAGVALATGYGIGAAVGGLARWLLRVRPPPWVRAAARRTSALLAAALVLWSLTLHYRWQADVRSLMQVDPGMLYYPFALTVALAACYVVVVAGRLATSLHRAYARVLARVLPSRLLRPVRLGLAVLLVFLLVDVLLLERTFSALDAALAAGDARLDPAVAQPATPYRAGGRGSLVPWESLGANGRAFVAQGPTVRELTAFSGEPATPPIRVYAGLASAGSVQERARLAVAELERAGAFEREVIVVITPTGSGGVNPYAIDPLEYLYNGSTAAVAVQYSHLPSWVMMVGNQDRAKHAAAALFDAVSDRLRRQPAASRPLLLVYGESLGAFGSEATFAGLDDVRARTDGVLWVGPPRVNELWRELTFGRDPGSPLWQPVYEGGRRVRFGTDGEDLARPGGPWERPRVAYLQHATDPITWWSPALLFERPGWLREPRGPDVSQHMPYLPAVTFWQVTVDMALGAGAPVGHGHVFGPEQAEAWAHVAPPPDWSRDDTRRLLALLGPRTRLTHG